MLFAAIKMFIPENTARKVQINSGNIGAALVELCAPNQLEEKYGGKAKNKEEGEYWPVQLPDDDFLSTAGEAVATPYEAGDDDEFKDCE